MVGEGVDGGRLAGVGASDKGDFSPHVWWKLGDIMGRSGVDNVGEQFHRGLVWFSL